MNANDSSTNNSIVSADSETLSGAMKCVRKAPSSMDVIAQRFITEVTIAYMTTGRAYCLVSFAARTVTGILIMTSSTHPMSDCTMSTGNTGRFERMHMINAKESAVASEMPKEMLIFGGILRRATE